MLIALLVVFLKISLEHFRRRGKSDEIPTPEKSTTTVEVPKLQYRTEKRKFTHPKTRIMSNSQQQMQSEGVDCADGSTVIVFKPGDRHLCHEIVDKNVMVIGTAGTHDHGSSNVKLKNIVDYKWENKIYPGRLIAVHIDGRHIAYAINVNTKVSRMEGMVRVVNAHTGMRALIKGMVGEVLDLQFAHIECERVLATIDLNSMYVHRIDILNETLVCNLLLKVEDPLANYTPTFDKISWCPYIDMPDEDDEDNKLIVWARGSVFQCFNVNGIVAEHGVGNIHTDAINTGYLKFQDDAMTITWVALSPDGSTLGVGSTDGFIRFYQVYMHDKEPRCLHQWKPHNGKPVSSFFFLDNLTRNVSETYWKYAITGAANNTELKVWDCGTWECLQTLNITIDKDDKKLPHFIAEMDRTASHLVISSLETRTCYVLQIVNNNCTPSKDGDTDSAKDTSSSSSAASIAREQRALITPLVYIKSISEFPLNSGILSFSIVDAAVRRYKCPSENYSCDDLDDYDEETNSVYCVVIRMFIVQCKSMQECHILYSPSVTESTDVKSTISGDSAATNSSKDSSGIEGISNIGGTNNKSLNGENDDECNDTDEGDRVNDDNVHINSIKQEMQTSENKALEALLGIGNNNQANTQSSTTNSSSKMGLSAPAVIEKTDSSTASPQMAGNTSGKNYSQLNLMTPDAFNSTVIDKKTPESGVSSEVLNTILMLASVAGQKGSASKPDNLKRMNLVNNKIIEDQEHQKIKLKQTMESQKNFIAIDNNPGRNVSDNLTSGGSSPSREVQEIMSLQEFDKSSYSGDELIDERPSQAVTASTNTSKSCQEHISGSKSQPSTTNWPKAPDVHKVTTKHSAELQNAANVMSQAVNASSVGSLNCNHMASAANSAELSEINMKMNQLIELIKVQSMQINSLQNEIADIKRVNPMVSAKSMSEFSFKLEMQLSKLMEQYLKRYENEHKKKLNAFIAGKDVQNRELRESFLQISNQYILTQFGEVVSKVISMEFQCQLAPMLGTKIDHLQQQIHMDVAQKLSGFDMMLRENIAQVCKSKHIIEAFGKSVLVGVQGSLQAAFIESMSSTLIPAYEKSSQNMFKQLHDAFSDGIKEVMDQFDNYLQHFQPMQDSSEDILNKMLSFRQHVDTTFQTHNTNMAETMLETRKDIKNMEVLLARQVQECIRVEVQKCFENQAVALRSQANTPAPTYDLREAIKMLLHQGHINKAFHQALIANDLNLVEFTLKSADHNAVFTPVCCLEQKVLLSLIQQISADMSNHNEVKQNYLAEALLAINPVDPITREHAPTVLQELFRNCQMFLMNYPKSSQCSNVRMLLKAVQAFKDQF